MQEITINGKLVGGGGVIGDCNILQQTAAAQRAP